MSIIRPFRALRPSPERVSQVAAVPYDVVSTDEARAMANDNPLSFLHISRAEIDLPGDTPAHSSAVYERALANFNELKTRCPLIQDQQPKLYIYQLRLGDHKQTGIAGCFSVAEYNSNIIRKHERTRKDKEDDRTRHILQLAAQTGPVFLTYPDVSMINQRVEQITKQSVPLYQFQASDQVEHTVWAIEDTNPWTSLFQESVPYLYIADGHHRAAAASRACEELKSKNVHPTGNEDYCFFMAVAFPASQLRILPYHRTVKDLGGMPAAEFYSRVQELFLVRTTQSANAPARGEIGMFFQNQWHLLSPKPHVSKYPFDVDLLQSTILGPILGIQDPRTDKRIDFVGGSRGTQELEKQVKQGSAQVAFAVHPVEIEDVIRIADQGGIMPPKSTWFEPKLRDGILSHCI